MVKKTFKTRSNTSCLLLIFLPRRGRNLRRYTDDFKTSDQLLLFLGGAASRRWGAWGGLQAFNLGFLRIHGEHEGLFAECGGNAFPLNLCPGLRLAAHSGIQL